DPVDVERQQHARGVLDLGQRPRAAHGDPRRFFRARAVELDVEQHAGALARPLHEVIDQPFLEARGGELAGAVGGVRADELAALARAALVHALDYRRHRRLQAAVLHAAGHQAGMAARAVGRGDRATLPDRVRGEVEAEILALLGHLLGATPTVHVD